jgi:hypothetical protein
MDDKPPEKPTVELAAPPAWAIDLTTNMKAGFAAVNGRLDTMEANLDLQGVTVRDVATRMTAVEQRQNAMDARQSNNSMAVKNESKSNLDQDAAIASIKVAVDDLVTKQDTQMAMLGRIESAGKQIIANPTVRKVASLAALALTIWLSTWISNHGVKLP